MSFSHLPAKHLLRGLARYRLVPGLLIGVSMTFLGSYLVGFLHTHTHTPIVKTVEAVAGTLSISGTDTTITGDITAARLLDQANTAYFIDPAGSGTSLVTAGKVGFGTTTITDTINVSGNIGFTSGPKIKDNAGSLQLQAGGTGTGSTGTGSIYFLDSTGTARGRFEAVAPTYIGSGADGAITVTATKNLNTDIIGASRSTYADGIAYRVIAPADSATSVTRYSGTDTISNGIAANDEVLLINLQGASGDTTDVGNYEFMKVSSVTASTITFSTAITKTFAGTTASNQKVVIQRVPQYTNVTLSGSGSLTASAWEALATTPTGAAGYLTGIVVLRATGTVTVGSGTSIAVNAKGYRYSGDGSNTSYQGESRAGLGASWSSGGPANDGGGGAGSVTSNMVDYGGGGGAGYGTAGTEATGNNTVYQGNGGGTYGSVNLSTIFLGSGGGISWCGGTGGSGGSIVFVSATTLTINGSISANGANGAGGCTGAGGGSGGSIYLLGATITLGSSLVTSSGGTGSTNTYTGATSTGGNGGTGIIRVEYTGTLSGTTSPAASTATSVSSNANSPLPAAAGAYGTYYLGSTNTSSQDLAEYYVSGDKSIEAGDVVVASRQLSVVRQDGEAVDNKGVLMKAAMPYDRNLIGIISTSPGVLMGSVDGENKEDKRMLALAGRVPVKIDPDSEPIAIGDFLTSSDKPGLAQKATRPGYVVGRALEDWTSCADHVPQSGAHQSCGPSTIDAFIQLTYYMGDIDPWGNFRTLEVDTLKVNKTLEVGGVNVLDEINDLKRRLDAIEAR